MKWRKTRAVVTTLLVSLLLIVSSEFIEVYAAQTYAFTATILPTQVTANQIVTYTVTATDTGTTSLGSISLTIPEGFTTAGTVTIMSAPASWYYNLSATTISLTNTGGASIAPGESIVFTFDATATAALGVTTWTATATSSIDGGGNTLFIQGSQPTVLVTLSEPLIAPTVSASPSTIDQGQASQLVQLTPPSGGKPPYTYQWSQSLEGEPFSIIPGANSATYTFSTVTSTATGTWSFKLTVNDSSNVPATATSNQISVIVNSALIAPTIIAAPDVVNQSQASTLTSSSMVTGTPPYAYRWFQKAPDNEYARVGNNSPSYTFPGSTTAGTWAFLLQVTDNTGTSINSTSAEVTVEARSTFTITVVGPAHGAINPGTTSVIQGGSQLFTITPETGYRIADVSVDGVSFGALTSYTFTNINADHSLTATFTQIEYTLGVSSVGNGSVTVTPSQPAYHYGDVVQLTATPAAGWSFTGWTGDLYRSSNPISIVINGTTSITAHFVQNAYTLVFSVIGGGIVNKSPDQASYNLGAIVTLSAAPYTGWSFGGWSGDITSSSGFVSVIVNGTTYVTATFVQNTYPLTISTNGGGSVIVSPDQALYHSGDVVQLTANPHSGWRFAGWSGDLTSTLNPISITINGSTAVTALFLSNQLTITSSAGAGGSINPSGTTIVDYGGGKTFSITPNIGYRVADVLINGTSIGPVDVFAVSNVTGDTTITVSFSSDTVSIDASAGPNGTISPLGTVLVTWNGTVRFTITPDENYHIESVLLDGIPIGTLDTYTFAYVTASHNITAEFAKDASFSITVTSQHGNPTASAQVSAGGNLNVSVTGIDGDTSHRWICIGYSLDGGSTVSGTNYTFTNIQANHVITFHWQEQYHLTVNTQVSVASGTGWYNVDTTASASVSSLTITVETGKRQIFIGWSGDANGAAPTTTSIVMNGPKTVTANWKTQYYLSVTSNGGNPKGQGWYDEGATATIDIEMPAQNSSDIRIILTWKGTESGYTGNAVSSQVTMSRAIVEEAVLTTQYLVTYKLSGNPLHADLPPSEWVTSGSKATGAFAKTVTNPAGNTRDFFVGDNRPDKVTAPSTIVGTYKTQYLVQFIQKGLNFEVQGTIAIVLGEPKTNGKLPKSVWIDKGESVTFTYVESVEVPNGEKYFLKNVNCTSPFPVDEPMIVYAEYALEMQSTFDTNMIAFLAVGICSVALSPIPLLAWRRRKRIITPHAGEGGYISPSTAQRIKPGGNSTVFIITARYGYEIRDVVIDDKVHLGPVRTYKFIEVKESHKISAAFSRR